MWLQYPPDPKYVGLLLQPAVVFPVLYITFTSSWYHRRHYVTHCAIGLLFTKESQSWRQNDVFTCAKTFCNPGTETVTPNHYLRPQPSVYRFWNYVSKSLLKTIKNQPSVCQPCLHWVELCWKLCDSSFTGDEADCEMNGCCHPACSVRLIQRCSY